MNRLILYTPLAALALAIAACSEQADFTQADIANAAIENANAGDVPVAFGTYVGTGGTTRSGEIGEIADNSILKGTNTTSAGSGHNVNGFGVFAFNTGTLTWAERDGSAGKEKVIPNFMYNERVYWDADTWKYATIKYWPNGIDKQNADNSPSNTAIATSIQYLTFFAYAPYTYLTESSGKEKASSTTAGYEVEASQKGSVGNGITNITSNGTAGDPIITYSLPASNPTGKNTVDLLWGIRGQLTYEETDESNNTIGALGNSVYNTDLTKQKVDERVRFLFKHALAKIADIKVVYDIDGNGSGETGFGNNDDNTLVTISSVTIKTKDADAVYKSAQFDIATGVWSTTNSSKFASAFALLTGTEELNAEIAEPGSAPKHPSGWTLSDGTTALPGVKKEAKDLYSTYDPIMFIPVPTFTPQLTVEVIYVVRSYDPKLNKDASGEGEGATWTKVTQTITNDVTLPQLNPNTKYTLVMHLGMTSVKFSAEVADWDEGAVKEVWLPSNVVANKTSANIGATATSYDFDFSSYIAAIGDYVSNSKDGDFSGSTVTVNTETNHATISAEANTSVNAKNGTITIVGTKGKVILTLTQDAAAITISDLSDGKVTVSGPSDLDLTAATITVSNGTTTFENDAAADGTHYSYDNTANPKTVTLPNAAGTYSVTIKQGDATATKTDLVIGS